MTDPATYRPKTGEIPEAPGVYRFSDPEGRVIYVGKAKSLRARLNSYFADPSTLHTRTRQMVTTANGVDWTVVGNEVEALQLEFTWIKEFDPRFNVMYRDDKSYPWLAITVGEEIPRIQVMRGTRRKGVRYFGPYSHAWAIRETVDQILRVFPMRSCSSGVYRRHQLMGRPCLLGDIGKCAAPCVERVDAGEHREIVDDVLKFLSGRATPYIAQLKREMKQASSELEFERAGRLRDDIIALEKALERNAVVLPDDTDADVIALAEDPLEVAVQIFTVRGGRIRGQRGWVADKVDDAQTPALVERALVKLYDAGGDAGIPKEILVQQLPENTDVLSDWLRDLRGGAVRIRVPQRGDKKDLLATVGVNATQTLARHKVKRAGDLTTRSRALEEIRDALDLSEAPLRIECFDISNLQGTEIVASMVVFEDGLPKKREYRRFTVRYEGQNDVAAMHEVVTRRFTALLASRAEGAEEPGIDPETGRPAKFAYAPSLVVVDGGPPQVAAAQRALDELGITDVAVCGLAKRLEEVWLPDDEDPVILSRTSEGLYVLQRIRDEAHRFAISHHRQRRSKAMTRSALDGVKGLGETRRKALLRRFGSLKKVRAASVEEICEVPGIGPATAQAVLDALAVENGDANIAVDMATGEILEDQ